MQAANLKRQRKNYLGLLPAEPLSKILFFLSEADRRDSIVKMKEFQAALHKHDSYMKNIAEKALEMVRKDKDLKAAAALVEKHRRLLTTKFSKALASWAFYDVAAQEISEIAEQIHSFAKKIDPSCTIGRVMWDAEELYHDASDDDETPDPYNWRHPMEEYPRVIWVRFGSIAVHYLLDSSYNPHLAAGGNGSRVELHVYAQPNEKLITGRIFSYWKTSNGASIVGSSISQMGSIEGSEEKIILATAIGLVADVGRSSQAIAVAHCMKHGAFCMIENVALALRLCGRSFATLKAKQETVEPELVKVLC